MRHPTSAGKGEISPGRPECRAGGRRQAAVPCTPASCADLAVRGSGGDDDLVVLVVAPAAGAVVGEVADLEGVFELGGVGGGRGDEVVVAVAGDWL